MYKIWRQSNFFTKITSLFELTFVLKKKSYKKNIINLMIVQFFMNFFMVQVIQTIFMSANGMSLTNIGIIYAMYQLTKISFEVPTGLIADRYGRKISTILGLVSLVFSLATAYFFRNFIAFLISALFQGISYTFISGATDALFIDSVYAASDKQKFEKYNAILRAITYAAIFASSVLGGYIAGYSLDYIYIITILFQFVPIIILIFFVIEPPYKGSSNNNIVKKIKLTTVISFIYSSKLIVWLLSIDIFISVALIPIEAHYFNSFKAQGVSEEISGLIYGMQYLIASMTGLALGKYIRKYVGNKVIIILPLIMMISVFVFSTFTNVYSKVLFYYFALLALCIFAPVKAALLHNVIESSYRASILSFQSLCMSGIALIIQPVFGYFAENYGYQIAMQGVTLFSIALLTITCYNLSRLILQPHEQLLQSKNAL